MIGIFAETWEFSGAAETKTVAKRANVGETVGMTGHRHKSARKILLAMILAGFWMSGCGSSGAANQVVVLVIPSQLVLVPTQTQTITATVTGATDVSATFDCSYTTTPNPTTAVPSPKPSASAQCTAATDNSTTPPTPNAVGTLSNVVNTSTTVASTATFTAPAKFPNQTMFPNVLVTITATSNADKKKTVT